MSMLDRIWSGWRNTYLQSVNENGPRPDCVFCAILASGEPDTETHILWRHPEGRVFAILNAYPYTSGHLMVMPTTHFANLEEAGPDFFEGVQLAVRAVKAAYKPEGINVGANLGHAAGAGVPGHLHMHVMPRWVGDTNFMTTVANARVLPEPLSVSDTRLREAWPANG